METMTAKQFRQGNGFMSWQLRRQFPDNIKDDQLVINFAYTDYGGSFIDKVIIAFLRSKHVQHMLHEHTSWSGENCTLYSKKYVKFFNRDFKDWFYNDEFEEFYCQQEYQIQDECWNYVANEFIQDYELDESMKSDIVNFLHEEFDRYYSIVYTQVDYSSENAESKLCEHFNIKQAK